MRLDCSGRSSTCYSGVEVDRKWEKRSQAGGVLYDKSEGVAEDIVVLEGA